MLLFRTLSLTLLLLITSSKYSHSQWARGDISDFKQDPNWIFESETLQGSQVLYNRGKYRIRVRKDDGDFLFYYFDKSMPYIIWTYNHRTKTAVPTEDSCRYFFGLTVKNRNPKNILKQYGIPENTLNIRLLTHPYGVRLGSFYGFPQLYMVFKKSNKQFMNGYKKINVSKICGYECDVFEKKRGNSGTELYYVERVSNLVLRNENKKMITHNETQKMLSSIEGARTFRFLKFINDQEFRLPKSTTIVLPKLMMKIKLPAGYKRKEMTGIYKDLGFDLRTIFSFRPEPRAAKESRK